jgi:prevent-host-death family protein
MRIVTMPLSDLRRDLSTVIPNLTQPVFVTQRGRVKAVLMDIEAYNDLLDDLDDARLAADPEFQASLAEAKSGQTVPFDVALKENGLIPH